MIAADLFYKDSAGNLVVQKKAAEYLHMCGHVGRVEKERNSSVDVHLLVYTVF